MMSRRLRSPDWTEYPVSTYSVTQVKTTLEYTFPIKGFTQSGLPRKPSRNHSPPPAAIENQYPYQTPAAKGLPSGVSTENLPPYPTPTENQRPSPTPTENQRPYLTENKSPYPTENQLSYPPPTPSKNQRPSPTQSQNQRPSPRPTENQRPYTSETEKPRPSPTPSKNQRPSPTQSQNQRPSPTPTENQRPYPSQTEKPRPSPTPTENQRLSPTRTQNQQDYNNNVEKLKWLEQRLDKLLESRESLIKASKNAEDQLDIQIQEINQKLGKSETVPSSKLARVPLTKSTTSGANRVSGPTSGSPVEQGDMGVTDDDSPMPIGRERPSDNRQPNTTSSQVMNVGFKPTESPVRREFETEHDSPMVTEGERPSNNRQPATTTSTEVFNICLKPTESPLPALPPEDPTTVEGLFKRVNHIENKARREVDNLEEQEAYLKAQMDALRRPPNGG